MRWPAAKRSLGVYATLLGLALAVCGWQRAEHQRFERAAADALIRRGRDITSTLGEVVRSQRRSGGVVSKDRVEAALNALVRPGAPEAIASLGSTGETIAIAGKAVELTPEMLRARGVFWRDHTLTLMNLMDLGGTNVPEDPTRTPPPSAIVVTDPRAFRPTPNRRPSGDATKAGD